MPKQHEYLMEIKWTGNVGSGTNDYSGYERSHTVTIEGKPVLECSSDAAFRGDKTKHTPEDLLVASLSGCHMLWYLHLCSEAGVVVVDYVDTARGYLTETADGAGHFTEVLLSPVVTVREPSMVAKADDLHKKANEMCFIARSVKFPVYHKPACFVFSE